ncbi:flagellar protein FlgN [Aneurinibacillus uraniidurans]|uniref:flagellar protein FlgN n=1 Tax=Aneurinibacillus uraniidurans TaxID=2966586 RepID=UPI0023499FA2|nr:flagellar protein FlgN [Aneurinibacillus sp. B1]WCN38131.1 flagellar protein FlgN [Aneurinibacillus sp. B1]
MSDILDIIEILERLIVEHDRMMKLANHKKEVLITGKIDELARIVQFESRCISTIQSLELEREKQISLYLMQRGIRKETCYLSDLIELESNPDVKLELARCQMQLGNLVKELQELNHLNQRLIEQSLEFVNMSLEEMTAPAEEPVYKPTQQPQGRGVTRFFDSKA